MYIARCIPSNNGKDIKKDNKDDIMSNIRLVFVL